MQRNVYLLLLLVVVLVPFWLSCPVHTDDPHRPPPEKALSDPNGPVVYIGIAGNTYHQEGCSIMKLEQHPISLVDAKRFYKPCKKCKPVE